MTKRQTPRWAWALTGSGHFLKESLALIRELEDVDLFLSKAAAEVLRMYKQDLALPKSARVFRDKSASAATVGQFYYGVYHTSSSPRRPRTRSRNSSMAFPTISSPTSSLRAASAACR